MEYLIVYIIFGIIINIFYLTHQVKKTGQIIVEDLYWALFFIIGSPIVLFFILRQIKDFVLFKKK